MNIDKLILMHREINLDRWMNIKVNIHRCMDIDKHVEERELNCVHGS